jgi:hypothetical protein
MPHTTTFQDALRQKENAFLTAMGMSRGPSSAAHAVSIEAQTALVDDEIRSSEPEHRGILNSESVVIAQRVTPWGRIDIRPMAIAFVRTHLIEHVALRFHLHALVSEPELNSVPEHFREIWSLDRAFTETVHKFVRCYRGREKMKVQTGESHLDAVVVHVGGTAGATNWRTAGEALSTVFCEQFDQWVVKATDRARNIRHAALRR